MAFQRGKYKFARQRASPNGSTCVGSLRFELLESSLVVHFVQVQSYEYTDLPADVYLDFKGASSRGSYFNENIRNNYSFTRIG